MNTTVDEHGVRRNPIWTAFLKLLKKEYPYCFNDHMEKEHLNLDPCSLGLRCAGLPGHVCSTNGLEKRGGNIKEHYKNITNHVPRSTRNILHVAMAFAADFDASCDNVSQFASNPMKDTQDYVIPRIIASQQKAIKENSNPPNLAADVLYCICTAINDKTVVYDTTQVWFHNKQDSFAVHWPTAQIIYTIVNEQWKNISARMTSITVAEMREGLLDGVSGKIIREDGLDQIKSQLQKLDSKRKSALKKSLYADLLSNTHEPKPGETLDEYCYRLCQRNPTATSNKTCTGKRIVEMNKKKKEAANLARNKAKEQEKWGKNDIEPGSKGNIEDKFLEQFELLYSDDFDFSLEDAMLQLLDSSDLDMAEPESNHMVNVGKMIRVPRLLGAWIVD
jgi:hypothetical protein